MSNHSNGSFPMDVPVFAFGFYEAFGYDRPVCTLNQDILFHGRAAVVLSKTGFIPASHQNAVQALRAGGVVVVVFSGGD